MVDLKAAEKRCDAATGVDEWDEWDVMCFDPEAGLSCTIRRGLPDPKKWYVEGFYHLDKEQAEADKQFVINARQDLPDCIAEIKRLRKTEKLLSEIIATRGGFSYRCGQFMCCLDVTRDQIKKARNLLGE